MVGENDQNTKQLASCFKLLCAQLFMQLKEVSMLNKQV